MIFNGVGTDNLLGGRCREEKRFWFEPRGAPLSILIGSREGTIGDKGDLQTMMKKPRGGRVVSALVAAERLLTLKSGREEPKRKKGKVNVLRN